MKQKHKSLCRAIYDCRSIKELEERLLQASGFEHASHKTKLRWKKAEESMRSKLIDELE
jgi:hypothetical protein